MRPSRSSIQCSIDDQIARIKLDNPAKHNALTVADIESFIAHLDSIESNPALRVLIISGSGDKTFCAGASLDELAQGKLDSRHFDQLTDKLAATGIATICAFNGSVFGGGTELGLCCDLRIGVHGMKLMVPAARFGLCYPHKGIQRFVQRLGHTASKRILMASEELDSDALLALGYLSHLVAPEQLQASAQRMAQALCRLAPLAVSSMNQLCDQAAAGTLDAGRASALVRRCHQSQDLQEGLRARAEKRAPVFSGH
jgi:enoyl-CoA hydratase/carnithine racemase